ncbi:MAG: hypothetical protein KI791_20975 [Cyclobacteriaceae bacterium]|nr:hypothetical protein [Cyclobacteriaceae bacterium SS2]
MKTISQVIIMNIKYQVSIRITTTIQTLIMKKRMNVARRKPVSCWPAW